MNSSGEAALALAVRAQLRDATGNGGMGLTALQCDLAPVGGRPPAMAAERFAGIDVGEVTTKPVTHGLRETLTIDITVTFRLGRAPFDRYGAKIMGESGTGLWDFCADVRRIVNSDYYTFCITSRANILLGYDANPATATKPTAGFVPGTGLKYLGSSKPFVVHGDWFLGSEQDLSGIARVLRFGGIERVQSDIGTNNIDDDTGA